jgi:adenylate cyclase
MWGLGYPEQARAKADAALELARKLEIPHCEVQALFFSCWLHLIARNVSEAAANLQVLEELATRHGLRQFQAESTAMHGCLLVQQGEDFSTAAELLERGLAEQAATGVQLKSPWFMATLAEARAARGRPHEARAQVDEAVAISGRTGELLDRMQALTVKGELCAAASEDDEAAACFEEAIAVARTQAAKAMELRAATRLARLRQRQGKVAEARAVISDITGWFTEGFGTPDLREARVLIENLDGAGSRAEPKTRRAR